MSWLLRLDDDGFTEVYYTLLRISGLSHNKEQKKGETTTGTTKSNHMIKDTKQPLHFPHSPVLFFRFSRSAFSSSMAWDFLSSFSSRLERRSLLWDVTWEGKDMSDGSFYQLLMVRFSTPNNYSLNSPLWLYIGGRNWNSFKGREHPLVDKEDRAVKSVPVLPA